MNHSIVHIITTIDLGGAEKQLLTLAACQIEAGFDVEVIFLKDKPALLQDFLGLGVGVDLQFAQLSFLRQCLKLKRREFKEDSIVHAHLPRAELLCALTLKRKRFLVTRHNSEAFYPRGPAQLSKLLSRFVLHKAFASICISMAVENFLKSSGEMSSSQKNLVIYYGLKDTSVSPNETARTQSRPFQVGTVSRLVPQKNIALLLSALAELNFQGLASFELTVVGIGPLERELKSMVVSLGIKEVVSWRGQLQDIVPFYRSLDIFVLPSDYEGFGLVLLEAMSHGVPVVARRISAIPEVMGPEHPGLVNSDNPIDLANTIRLLLTDEANLNKCLRYQINRLNEFPISKAQSMYEQLYIEMLKRKT